MKSKEELNALKEEVETLNRKIHELTDDELSQVSGGASAIGADPPLGQNNDMETNDVRGFTPFKLDIG